MNTQVPAQWWVRSFADRDTHRGTYSEASRSVHAACGIEFVPLPVGIPARRQPLPGYPQDPDQICPECARYPKPQVAQPVPVRECHARGTGGGTARTMQVGL